MNLNHLDKLSLRIKKIIEILDKGDVDFINTSKTTPIDKEFLIKIQNTIENTIKKLDSN
tara:strand:+ start:2508 stop:2684 length:177 start_codon:yes stop_codon:yes gene_type:complete